SYSHLSISIISISKMKKEEKPRDRKKASDSLGIYPPYNDSGCWWNKRLKAMYGEEGLKVLLEKSERVKVI
ncbi:MAG: hypothetical protein NTX38_17235, partial [Methylobacter sp.]|nr:hypothetical protein [Methylobacter sp.]